MCSTLPLETNILTHTVCTAGPTQASEWCTAHWTLKRPKTQHNVAALQPWQTGPTQSLNVEGKTRLCPAWCEDIVVCGPQGESEMRVSCMICVDIIVQNQEVLATPCGHTFHAHCIIEWIKV
ncbi:hypothetical protein E2C01_065978 [Portunus trituberculatus]|uniref:RING-type domain-containing protein n=1 Tax=Portunus trituberculatus TaxID=210409 RepID=A0A5B7HNK5_PORTR|nr:hypothetical protein [Portunus trituberculatus]